MSRRRVKFLAWAAGAGVLVLLLAVIVEKGSNSRQFQAFGELIQRVDTTDKVVALTFDDGPTPGDTENILQILADRDVTATFFLMGSAIDENLTQAEEIVDAGHQVGNHTWSHRQMWFITPGEVRTELDDTDEAIRTAGYEGTIDFRPPFGKKLFVLPWILQERGTRTITWDVSPEDFTGKVQSADELRDIVVEAVQPGSIILLHPMDGRTTTQDATALIIDSLKDEGYRFVTVNELAALRSD